MWLYTQEGAFSVVAKREGNGRDATSKTQLWVRSRNATHLAQIKALMHWTMPTLDSEATDYQYRIVVSRNQWYALVRRLAEDVRYPNFKGRVAEREGGSRYERMLHYVWDLVQRHLDERVSPEQRAYWQREGDAEDGA